MTHSAVTCTKLLKLTIPDRFSFLREKRVCFICLGATLNKCKCKETNRGCKKCGWKHHEILHDDNYRPKPVVGHIGVVASVGKGPRQVPVVPTARIKVYGENSEKYILVRALIDGGAQISLITQECINKLKIKVNPTDTAVTTYCGSSGDALLGKVNLKISPAFQSQLSFNVEAYVTRGLTNDLPSESCTFETEPYRFDKLDLADYEYGWSSPIDMILGITFYRDIIENKLIRIGKAVLQKTKLGYIVFGEGAAHGRPGGTTSTSVSAILREPELKLGLERFFEYELDEMEKEDYVNDFYQKTVKVTEDGYTVCIPWKLNRQLGESKKITMGRVRSMVKRLKPDVLEEYVRQCDDLISKGYMVEPQTGIEGKNYIANFALKTNSLTTPVRLLFTCDQKTSNGQSVNDVQHCGPKLQNDLPSCILKFRFNKVAITGDITKMYLQIKLDPKDAQFQRTFIARSADGPLVEMELPTVIFGMKSAPFLALRTLIHIADSVKSESPIASRMLKNNFYVDDLLDSFNSEEEASQALQELKKALKLGKFELKKIASSHNKVLENIPVHDTLESISKELEEDLHDEVKVLGIMWDKRRDEMHYKVKLDEIINGVTKRIATSEIAKIYDPTGYLVPALVAAKIMIQDMWRLDQGKDKSAWDEPVPEEIAQQFGQWRSELPLLREIRIKRWLGHSPNNKEEILLGFADASTKAYGCVIYLRTVTEHDEVEIAIVGAKSKVTPLAKKFVPAKKEDELTLPRLELMAATMLANYMAIVKEALKIENIVAFTDSQITLAWIQGNENNWQTFVANRVMKIKEVLQENQWYYVNTKNNPADLASRPINPSQMLKEEGDLWFNGPTFARERKLCPEQAKFYTKVDEKKVIAAVNVQKRNDLVEQCEKFSTWTKTVRVMAYVLRMKQILNRIKQRKTSKATEKLTWGEQLGAKECSNAETLIIKLYQQQEYSNEIDAIKEGGNYKSGKLNKLTPFLDQNGILRVGGRLEEAKFITYNEKHPIILPPMYKMEITSDTNERKSSLSRKIVDWAHLSTLHGGELKTQTFLKQKFHIPNGRNSIRYAIHRCMICSIHRAKSFTQRMGNLPKECVNPAPPFYHTTMDYAGPIPIKFGSGRGRKPKDDDVKTIIKTKAWIAIFVCRLTGAYHIEVVSELTAEACVEAFKRFISTRGLPKTVISDNAGNYVKAAKMLKREENKADRIAIEAIIAGEMEIQTQFAFQKVEVFTNEEVCQWKFIPPLSPDFGGKHESAVKQVKIHLKKTIGLHILSFEKLMTVLKQIEAMLNSRPLCRAEGTAGEKDQILTPAHYLVGRQLNALPEPDYTTTPNLADRYQLLQSMTQQCWKRWHKEYLGTLQQSQKWTTTEKEVQIGEIVLLIEENTPPLVWRKVKVTEVHPGKDGHVRVVTVMDATKTTFKRSIRKIVRLPFLERGGTAAPTATTDEMKVPVSPKKPKENKKDETVVINPKPDPPLRRSARTRRGFGVNLLGMMMCLLICLPNAMTSPQPVENKETGMAYFFQNQVLIKIGTHHVDINTGLKPRQDAEEMKNMIEHYQKECARASKRFRLVRCEEFGNELDAQLQQMTAAMTTATATQITPRKKRSFHSGALVSMFKWLIGSWSDEVDSELHAKKSMGLITHAVQAFKDVETQLDSRQVRIKNELDRLEQGVNEEMSKIIAGIDQTRISVQLAGIYNLLVQHMQDIKNNYETADEFLLEKEELKIMIEKVNQEARMGKVPKMEPTQLYEIMNPMKRMINETIMIMIELPVVLDDIFEEYLVIPIPIEGTHKIADMNSHAIIVNRRLQQYVEGISVNLINETIGITKEPIHIFNKVTNGTDCAIVGFLKGHALCASRNLPTQYDIWMDTPMHNTFAYYTTESVEKICNNGRHTIKEQSGVIKLEDDCYIETKTTKIIASLDRNSVRKHGFHAILKEQTVDWTMNHMKVAPIKAGDTDMSRISDGALVDVLKDAVDASQEANTTDLTMYIVVAAITSVVTVVLVIVGIIGWIRCTNRPGQPIKEEIYEAVTIDQITNSTNETNRTSTV